MKLFVIPVTNHGPPTGSSLVTIPVTAPHTELESSEISATSAVASFRLLPGGSDSPNQNY